MTDVTRPLEAPPDASQRAAGHRAVNVMEAVRDTEGRLVDFRCVEINDTAAALLGVDPTTAIGRTTSELPGLRFSDEVAQRCVTAIESGEDAAWVESFDVPGLGVRHFRTTVLPIRDTIVAVGEDISEDWVEEQRLSKLVERAPVMITIVGDDGGVRWTSPGTRQVLGREPQELLGPPQLDKIHRDDAGALLSGVANLRNTHRRTDRGQSRDMEYRIRHADGRWRWINFAIEDFTGVEPIDGVVCYGQDVTEQHMAAEYAALDAEIHGAIVAGTPFDLVLQSLCDRLIEILDASVVWVGLAEDDGTVSVRGSAGPLRELFRGTSPRWDETPVGRGPVGECIRTRRTIISTTDAASRGGLDAGVAESLARLGITAGAAIPLIADQIAVGALGINVDDLSKLDPRTVATLEGIGSWIAVAISMNRGRQRERLLAAALAAAANAVAITDARGQITWVNDAYTASTGLSFADAVG